MTNPDKVLIQVKEFLDNGFETAAETKKQRAKIMRKIFASEFMTIDGVIPRELAIDSRNHENRL